MKDKKILVNKILAVFAIIFPIILFFGGAYLYKQKYFPKQEIEYQNITSQKNEEKSEDENQNEVKIVIQTSEDEKNEYKIKYKEEETAFQLLKRLNEENEGFSFEYEEFEKMGNMITTINEINPGEGNFWKFFVNNEESQVGVSDYKMEKGDEIKFKIDQVEDL